MEDESLPRKLIVRFDNHEEEATLFESAFAFDKKREIMRPHLPVVVAGSVRWVKMLLKRISGPITCEEPQGANPTKLLRINITYNFYS